MLFRHCNFRAEACIVEMPFLAKTEKKAVRTLGSHVDILPLHTSVLDGERNLGFGPVDLGRVDMTKSRTKGGRASPACLLGSAHIAALQYLLPKAMSPCVISIAAKKGS